MNYQVKELAELANISVRTLHYYDEIDLLKPSSIHENGYRSYDEAAVLRLQQIMFYRELDFSLKDIKTMLDDENFDTEAALKSHKQHLEKKRQHLQTLIQTIEQTLKHMKGETNMSAKELFEGFDEATQAAYEQEVIDLWGDTYVLEYRKRWSSYSKTKKQQIIEESNNVYVEIAKHLNQDVTSEHVQALIAQWHENLRYFYEPTRQLMLGLAQTYTNDIRFKKNFEKIHPDLPAFLRQAIEHYCESITPNP